MWVYIILVTDHLLLRVNPKSVQAEENKERKEKCIISLCEEMMNVIQSISRKQPLAAV